ncbi:MAG: glycoside hydrolase family 92 protein, partial [Bacteroides sp.]
QNSAANRYVHSATLNGKEYTKNFLKHGELLKGGMLHYGMSPAPNYARGTKTEDYPYSFSSSHP